ncbi:alpha/beta hydrolase [Microbacterium jejuense]|uniref:alpha/beta hydrolase n=1 Tax=Microbacterium jejuense TaxID=1263637 RepID=UPI0031F0D25D
MSLTSPNRGYPLERIDGNAGSMSWWVGSFDRAGQRLAELRTSLQTVRDLPGKGDAVVAARADAVQTSTALTADIVEAELLSRVLSRYADAHSAYAVPANRLVDEIEDAHAAAQRAQGAFEHAGQRALWTSYSGTTAEIETADQDARDAMVVRDTADRDLADLWASWESFYTNWDAAYDAALAALAGGSGVTLSRDASSLLDRLLAANGPAAVLAVWNEHPELRDELIAKHPEIIGNLDGIPYDVRADVNEARVRDLRSRKDLDATLTTELDVLWNEMQKHGGRLISFDPDGAEQTTAALWYGPLDATTVSTLVPGMMSQVSEMADWGVSARDLNDFVGSGSATIAWFGYDSPNFAEEPAMGRAQNGAPALRSLLQGLDAILPDSEIDVVAHSYGSTTAALAIGSAPDGLGVDKFVTVGSAGLPDDEDVRTNLQSPDAPRIYATMSERDFWAPVGQGTGFGHGTSPTVLDRVTEFDSNGGVDADGNSLLPTPGHSAHGGANFPWESSPGGYLQKGSESFYNVSSIIQTGEPGTEPGGEGTDIPFWTKVLEIQAQTGSYGYYY